MLQFPGAARETRVRDASAKRRDPPAVWRGSPPLGTVVSCPTEPQPDPSAARGTPEPKAVQSGAAMGCLNAAWAA